MDLSSLCEELCAFFFFSLSLFSLPLSHCLLQCAIVTTATDTHTVWFSVCPDFLLNLQPQIRFSLSSCEFKIIHTHFHDKQVNEWMQKIAQLFFFFFLPLSLFTCVAIACPSPSSPLPLRANVSAYKYSWTHGQLADAIACRPQRKSASCKWIPENQSANVCTSNAHLIEKEIPKKLWEREAGRERKHKVSLLHLTDWWLLDAHSCARVFPLPVVEIYMLSPSWKLHHMITRDLLVSRKK